MTPGWRGPGGLFRPARQAAQIPRRRPSGKSAMRIPEGPAGGPIGVIARSNLSADGGCKRQRGFNGPHATTAAPSIWRPRRVVTVSPYRRPIASRSSTAFCRAGSQFAPARDARPPRGSWANRPRSWGRQRRSVLGPTGTDFLTEGDSIRTWEAGGMNLNSRDMRRTSATMSEVPGLSSGAHHRTERTIHTPTPAGLSTSMITVGSVSSSGSGEWMAVTRSYAPSTSRSAVSGLPTTRRIVQ